ncbi:MAG: family 2A encapsulin nanocompartment cargo protein cysteine desulfurase [Porticoccaceae bacterium]
MPVAAGLPDIAALADIANALFRAIPGTDPLPAPQGAGNRVARSAPAGYPSPGGASADPVSAGRGSPPPGSFATGVNPGDFGLPGESELRELLAEPLRLTGNSGRSATQGGSAYYFAESLRAEPPPLAARDGITPGSFALPGQNGLNAALARHLAAVRPANHGDPTAVNGGGFYFLDSLTPVFGAPPSGAAVPAGLSVPAAARPFDVAGIRRDFPILAERVNGRPLVWFDNAATTHKPTAVIDRISYFYQHENSNIHRAAHQLAARATDAYEEARTTVARFIGAGSPEEIVFVRGATEAINLLANTFGRQYIGEGDEIIVSQLEHHANIVPWYQLANEVGARLRVIPVDDSGQLLLEEYRKLINNRTRLVAVTQVSNALGTIAPVKDIVDIAHAAGVCVLVDGAQAVSHMPIDVRALDADFYVFSGHKVFGPTGIGVIYGKAQLLEKLQPWQGGGNMIADVTFDRVVYQPPPGRFEAGTGNIADAVGLGAALQYLEQIGMERIARYEHDLLVYATERMRPIPGIRLIGTAASKASVLSFVLEGYSTEEVGKALNHEGIAVRSGHHCAQPILRRFGLEATVRPSFAFYNTCEEVDLMVSVVKRLADTRSQPAL